MKSLPPPLPTCSSDQEIFTITLDDRFLVFTVKYRDGWSWAFYDEHTDQHYTCPDPAKDQTTVLLLAVELVKAAIDGRNYWC